MKIILEFSHEEAKQAEQSYRGPEYAQALEDFRSFLKYEVTADHPEDVSRALQNVFQEFKDTFDHLLNA